MTYAVILSAGFVWFMSGCATASARVPVTPSTPPTFLGEVVGVHDGDSITVLARGIKEKIRLMGIDCPETDQPFGEAATLATTRLALHQTVTVTNRGRDRYHRLLGEIVLSDQRILNHELVREGACWWYHVYAPHNTTLQALETDARTLKRGLWADPAPTPPWEWRKQKK